jgi:hypothetical protein
MPKLHVLDRIMIGRDQPAADSFWFNPVAFCGHTWLHCEMGQ